MSSSTGASSSARSVPVITGISSFKVDASKVNAITSICKARLEQRPFSKYADVALGMTSDAASQWTQIEQLTTSILAPSQTSPVGTMSFHAWVKVIPRWLEFGKQALHFKEGVKVNFVGKKKWDEFTSLCKSGVYAAFQLCATISLGRGLYTKFNPQSAPVKAFTTIANLGASFLGIYTAIRGVQTFKKYRKLEQAKSLFGRVSIIEDKIAGLKKLTHVSSEELVKKLPSNLTNRIKFLEKQFQDVAVDKIAEVRAPLDLPDDYDIQSTIDHFAMDLSSEPCRRFFAEKYELDEDLISSLTSKAFMGLLLYRADLSIKKQEAFIDQFAETMEQKSQLRKQMITVLKTSDVANTRFGFIEDDLAAKTLFQTLDKAINRQQMKNIAVTVSCALTLAACLTSLFAPGAIGITIAMWIISNAIEYVVSLREFQMAVKEHSDKPLPSFKDANWKLKLLMTIDVVASLTSIAFAVFSITTSHSAGPALVTALASIIGVIAYNFFNMSTIFEKVREKLLRHASHIDEFVNQKFARFVGYPIDLEPSEETRLLSKQKEEKLIFTIDKLLQLDVAQKEILVRMLGEEPDRLALKPQGARLALSGDARTEFLRTKQGAWKYDSLMNQILREKFVEDTENSKDVYRRFKESQLKLRLLNVDTAARAI